MTPERLEIARRLVACKRWVWLPGMHAVAERRDWPGMGIRVDEARDGWLFYGRAANAEASMRPAGMVPNLDDDLTRLGVIAVVRKAWPGDEFQCARVEYVPGPNRPPWVCRVWDRAARWFFGFSEEAALLAALEAAP